jgi:5'-nucleotidase
MHILVSNDDGITAPGIRALTRALTEVAKVTVVAPDRERSATGHAITVHHPLRVRPVKDFYGADAFSVDGTPADCVKIALEALPIERPDLVIAGVNRGANLGTDVLYSGTVSAAIEGAILGFPAIAVSLADYREDGYEAAANFAAYLASTWHRQNLPPDTLLNVNWPKGTPKDIKITSLGKRRYMNTFEKRHDPWGREYFWMSGEVVADPDEKSDVWAVKNGYVSLTPIHFDLTNYPLLSHVRDWNLKL